MLRFAANGRADYADLDEATRAFIDAYVDGINGYIHGPAFKRPVECTLAGIPTADFSGPELLAVHR